MTLFSYSYDTKYEARKPGNQFEEIAYFAHSYWRGHLKLERLAKARFSSLVEKIGEIDAQTFNRLADEIDSDFILGLNLLRSRFPVRYVGPAIVGASS